MNLKQELKNSTKSILVSIVLIALTPFSVFTAQVKQAKKDSSIIVFAYTSRLYSNFGIGIIKPHKSFEVLEAPFNGYFEGTVGFLKEKHKRDRYKRIDIPDSVRKYFNYNINRMSIGFGYGAMSTLTDVFDVDIVGFSEFFDGRYRISNSDLLKLNPSYTSNKGYEDLKFQKIEVSLIISLVHSYKNRAMISWGAGGVLGTYLTENNTVADYKLFEKQYGFITFRMRLGLYF